MLHSTIFKFALNVFRILTIIFVGSYSTFGPNIFSENTIGMIRLIQSREKNVFVNWELNGSIPMFSVKHFET
jgi:hypothetical protein